MSRRTNLTTLRSSFSWNSFWYNKSFYTELVYLDLKITEYLTGIYYSMCLPSSYFYIKRLLNGIVIIEADIYLVNRSLKMIILFSLNITVYNRLLYTIGSYIFHYPKKNARIVSNCSSNRMKYNRFIWFFRFSTWAIRRKYNIHMNINNVVSNSRFIKLCTLLRNISRILRIKQSNCLKLYNKYNLLYLKNKKKLKRKDIKYSKKYNFLNIKDKKTYKKYKKLIKLRNKTNSFKFFRNRYLNSCNKTHNLINNSLHFRTLFFRLVNRNNKRISNISFNFKTFYNFYLLFFSTSIVKKLRTRRFEKYILYFFYYNLLYTNRIDFFTFSLALSKNIWLRHHISIFRFKSFLLSMLRSRNKPTVYTGSFNNLVFNSQQNFCSIDKTIKQFHRSSLIRGNKRAQRRKRRFGWRRWWRKHRKKVRKKRKLLNKKFNRRTNNPVRKKTQLKNGALRLKLINHLGSLKKLEYWKRRLQVNARNRELLGRRVGPSKVKPFSVFLNTIKFRRKMSRRFRRKRRIKKRFLKRRGNWRTRSIIRRRFRRRRAGPTPRRKLFLLSNKKLRRKLFKIRNGQLDNNNFNTINSTFSHKKRKYTSNNKISLQRTVTFNPNSSPKYMYFKKKYIRRSSLHRYYRKWSHYFHLKKHLLLENKHKKLKNVYNTVLQTYKYDKRVMSFRIGVIPVILKIKKNIRNLKKKTEYYKNLSMVGNYLRLTKSKRCSLPPFGHKSRVYLRTNLRTTIKKVSDHVHYIKNYKKVKRKNTLPKPRNFFRLKCRKYAHNWRRINYKWWRFGKKLRRFYIKRYYRNFFTNRVFGSSESKWLKWAWFIYLKYTIMRGRTNFYKLLAKMRSSEVYYEANEVSTRLMWMIGLREIDFEEKSGQIVKLRCNRILYGFRVLYWNNNLRFLGKRRKLSDNMYKKYGLDSTNRRRFWRNRGPVRVRSNGSDSNFFYIRRSHRENDDYVWCREHNVKNVVFTMFRRFRLLRSKFRICGNYWRKLRFVYAYKNIRKYKSKYKYKYKSRVRLRRTRTLLKSKSDALYPWTHKLYSRMSRSLNLVKTRSYLYSKKRKRRFLKGFWLAMMVRFFSDEYLQRLLYLITTHIRGSVGQHRKNIIRSLFWRLFILPHFFKQKKRHFRLSRRKTLKIFRNVIAKNYTSNLFYDHAEFLPAIYGGDAIGEQLYVNRRYDFNMTWWFRRVVTYRLPRFLRKKKRLI